MLIEHPEEMIRVSIPLLLGFAIIVGINLLVTKFAGLKYREGIISVIIGSSSHFEIAIATAINTPKPARRRTARSRSRGRSR